MVILQLHEQPPLIQSIFAGDLDATRKLLNNKTDVNLQDSEKRTALHAAAFQADADIAELLLLSGARVNAKDAKWITPLHRACSVNAARVVALLLNNNADVGARDRFWQTPLHIAAANNAFESLELLLDHVPNLDVTDRSGKTALHHAAHNGHPYIADLLISRGCVVNASDKKYFRPLHCAAQMGHVDTIDLLIKCGADVNASDWNQYTPLHVAAANGNYSVCRLLLNAGANVDSQNTYGNTPLHIACLNGQQLVCQDLISSGADPEAVNFHGQTPLHIAAASAHGAECMMYLLSQKVDVNKRSLDGRTPLHMTAIHGRFTRSKSLIDEGSIIDCTDKNGCTPLHIAAQYGHDLLANTLMCYGANPSFKGHEGRTPLHMCCLSGFVECCRKFLLAGIDLNATDDGGKTPLHCAAYKGSVECLDLLVSNGAKFLEKDNIDRLPIHYSASQGHYQCVFTLVGIGSPTNDDDCHGCTPLHLAAGYDKEGKCVEYLLQHSADPMRRDKRGFTPLHYATAGNNTIAVEILLGSSKYSNYFEKDCPTQVTPLHLAAKLGNDEVVRSLLSHGANVNAQDISGLTALMLAGREGHVQCVLSLVRGGASITICDNINCMTAVHYAAKNGHHECLLEMIRKEDGGYSINMVDSLQRTPLMLAVSFNHIECVRALLEHAVDVEEVVNMVDNDAHSSLFRAVAFGQNKIVQLLLAKSAKANCPDVNGKRVIHLAAACGHLACLQILMDFLESDNVTVLDRQDCTALHWACYRGNTSCVEVLLQTNLFKTVIGNKFSPIHCASFAGSFQCLQLLVNYYGTEIIHLQDSRKRYPLHICALHGHCEAAKFLLDQGAEVDILDEDERTPFIAAAQFGQNHIIELLLTYNVNKTYQDKYGNTALHWACLMKHSTTALLLLKDMKDYNLIHSINNENKTALHLAARNGLVDVTRELLRKGASVFAVDSEGYTPALCCAPNNQVAQCLALILLNLKNKDAEKTDPKESLKSFLQTDDYQKHFNTLGSFLMRTIQTQTAETVPAKKDSAENKRPYFDPPAWSKTPKILSSSTISSKSLFQSSWRKDRTTGEEIVGDEDNCFLIENNDFRGRDSSQIADKNDSENHIGLDLHRSLSNMSIVNHNERKSNVSGLLNVQNLKELSDRKKECRECMLWQKRCSDCTIRHILRQHLHGKTSPKEFNEFLLKSLNDTSSEYKQKLLQALEAIGKEFEHSCGKNIAPDIRRMVHLDRAKKHVGRNRSSSMGRIPLSRTQVRLDTRDFLRRTSAVKIAPWSHRYSSSVRSTNMENLTNQLFLSGGSRSAEVLVPEELKILEKEASSADATANKRVRLGSEGRRKKILQKRHSEDISYRRFAELICEERKPVFHPGFLKKLKDLKSDRRADNFEDVKDLVGALLKTRDSSEVYINDCVFTEDILLKHIRVVLEKLGPKNDNKDLGMNEGNDLSKSTENEAGTEDNECEKEDDNSTKALVSETFRPWMISKADITDAWMQFLPLMLENNEEKDKTTNEDDVPLSEEMENPTPVEDYLLPPKKIENGSNESLDCCLDIIPVTFVTDDEENDNETKITKVFMIEKKSSKTDIEQKSTGEEVLNLPYVTEKHIENFNFKVSSVAKGKIKSKKDFSCILC